MASKQKILIVDDDNNIAELISLYLTKECYDTKIVNDGEEAVREFHSFQPNLILLDLMLPGMDGYQVCREIRHDSDVPIIMLSAKGEVFDKVLGLELGADDYIIKPFDSKELVARVKAVLRRFQPSRTIPVSATAGKCVEYPDLIINQTNYSVIYQGRTVDMPPKELELLYFLASSPNQVFTREQLLDHIWGYEYIGDTRTVDVHIKRLREKIKDHASWAITTVWGIGYKFEVKKIMRRTLYRKLILIYVILAIAGFTLISTVGSRMVEDSLVSSASTSLYREATQIASKQGDLYYHSERSLTDLYNSLSALASYHNSQIWLISADGEILLNTAAALDEENPEIIDGFDPVALGSEYYSTGTFFGYFEDKMLSVMVPVTSDFRINGYVAIHLPLQDVYQQRESLLARIDFLFLLVFGLSFVILIFFLPRRVPAAEKIINGAKEYASGNLTHKIDVKSHDEMGYLASTLNYMSGELNKTGEYQRKFVANVSHDFRSPLTSIKGYVEAILDGTIPPEMQEKYLKIVLFETERLHKLTQSLLTLNDIDDKGNMLDLTSFDINAVIKDTAASFEGTCTKKRISISLILASRTLYVCADMGKIQQVLYNLIDNAIKFSNNDSTITVETTEKHGKVFVSVKDTGCGIPKASITKIWERFYKLDASRGKDRKGTGLGLSIVKEIITAHNQNINVISTEGVGTEFIFTLAKGEAPK